MDENPYKSPLGPAVSQPKSDGFPSERFVIAICVAIGAVIACFVIGGTIAFVQELFMPKN
jgi:hypothetical protein